MERDESVCNGTASDHSDWLKDRQGSEKATPVLWQKFKSDGGIDWDVSTHAKANKCSKNEDRVVVRRDTEEEAEDARAENCKVERPPPPHDINEHAPDKGTSREARREGGEDAAQFVI